MLSIRNLKTGYDDKVVVSLPTWSAEKGKKYLITGPSGSGKTTLLYALAGLGHIQEGTVTIDGTDIYAMSPDARDHFRGKTIGIVFQTLHLVKSLTVMDNLLLGSFLNDRPQDKDWARHLLDRLGIAALQDRSTTDISQGQAQRVAIARALLNKPKLLLADEPTSSLDDKAASQVVDLLSSLAAETGATLIVSSHDARIKNAFDHSLIMGDAA